MTFDEWCIRHEVTQGERVELAHRLAALRYRRTLDDCLRPSHFTTGGGRE